MRILLVDHSPSTRATFRDMLEHLGHQDVVEATDGIDAAKILQGDGVDLVISAWRMPHMDGMALLTTLRGRGNSVPVLVIMNKSERCLAISALQAGANSYIIKPFDAHTLADRIRQAVINTETPPR